MSDYQAPTPPCNKGEHEPIMFSKKGGYDAHDVFAQMITDKYIDGVKGIVNLKLCKKCGLVYWELEQE